MKRREHGKGSRHLHEGHPENQSDEWRRGNQKSGAGIQVSWQGKDERGKQQLAAELKAQREQPERSKEKYRAEDPANKSSMESKFQGNLPVILDAGIVP